MHDAVNVNSILLLLTATWFSHTCARQ